MTQLIIIKLPTGEELIGKGTINTAPIEELSNLYAKFGFVPDADEEQNLLQTSVTLEEVFQVLVIPKQEGNQDIALLPWHLYSDLHKSFTIDIEKLVYYTTGVDTKLADIYKRYTSKVVLPPKSGLIGV